MPIDEEERRAKLKRLILNHVADMQNAIGVSPVYEDFRNLVLAEFSDQTFYYNPDGEWEYSMMEVSGLDDGPHGKPTTTAVMDRPLTGYRWPCKDLTL